MPRPSAVRVPSCSSRPGRRLLSFQAGTARDCASSTPIGRRSGRLHGESDFPVLRWANASLNGKSPEVNNAGPMDSIKLSCRTDRLGRLRDW